MPMVTLLTMPAFRLPYSLLSFLWRNSGYRATHLIKGFRATPFYNKKARRPPVQLVSEQSRKIHCLHSQMLVTVTNLKPPVSKRQLPLWRTRLGVPVGVPVKCRKHNCQQRERHLGTALVSHAAAVTDLSSRAGLQQHHVPLSFT